MSHAALPISPPAFAAALTSLPLENLHAKAAELQNSIAHLRYSNAQMAPFAADGDDVCAQAVRENEGVIERMGERVGLVKAEVEGRGNLWILGDGEGMLGPLEWGEVGGEGDGEGERGREMANGERVVLDGVVHGEGGEQGSDRADGQGPNGERPRLTDEDLRRRLREQMSGGEGRNGDASQEDEGVHL